MQMLLQQSAKQHMKQSMALMCKIHSGNLSQSNGETKGAIKVHVHALYITLTDGQND